MTERAYDDVDGGRDDSRPTESNGELVHWMQAKPLSVGVAGISAAAASAFAVGVVAAVAVLALMHWVGPQRELAGRRWMRRHG